MPKADESLADCWICPRAVFEQLFELKASVYATFLRLGVTMKLVELLWDSDVCFVCILVFQALWLVDYMI